MSDYWFQQRYDDAYFALANDPVAIAESLGHDVEPDPGMSSADRWTCKRCGRAVLSTGTSIVPNIYGAASKERCDDESEA